MLEKVILPVVLALLMFGLGLSLRLADFRRSAQRWRLVLAALASIFLGMAAWAALLGRLFELAPPVAAGLMLLATCPGGMFSNMVTHSADGDTALSLTLTIASSLLYALVMPVSVLAWTALHASGGVHDLWATLFAMVTELLGVVVLPLACGLGVRARRPAWSLRHQAQVRHASSGLVALVFITLAIEQAPQFRSMGLAIAGAVLSLNLAGWGMAGLLKVAFGLSGRDLIAVGAEHGIRQEGLGVFVALTLLADARMVPPLLVNSFTGFLVTLLFVTGIRMLDARRRGAGTGLAVAGGQVSPVALSGREGAGA